MKNNDLQTFSMLKQKVAERMQQSYPGINPSIAEWKGQEIVDFQEELLRNVNAHISEKWFYNHMKTDSPSLPRIDMLNLLCRYAGYANWDDFKYKHADHSFPVPSPSTSNRYFFYIPALVIAVLGILFLIFKLFSSREYTFRFYDADTAEPITNTILEVSVLLPGESPVNHLCRSDGSFTMKTDRTVIRFVVESPYYETDTIIRTLDKFNRVETVKLNPDNYALMIHYFSNMNVKDWKQRRDQLSRMIADSALIFQVFGKESIGVELFGKWDFINKLTLPSTGLKNIEILDTRYQGDKISMIRFRQKEAER